MASDWVRNGPLLQWSDLVGLGRDRDLRPVLAQQWPRSPASACRWWSSPRWDSISSMPNWGDGYAHFRLRYAVFRRLRPMPAARVRARGRAGGFAPWSRPWRLPALRARWQWEPVGLAGVQASRACWVACCCCSPARAAARHDWLSRALRMAGREYLRHLSLACTGATRPAAGADATESPLRKSRRMDGFSCCIARW